MTEPGLIRERCAVLLASKAMDVVALGAALHCTPGEVALALDQAWHTFSRVAGAGCWHWTLTTSPMGRQAQREAVGMYAPGNYAPVTTPKERLKGQLTATSAIGRALLALGEGTIEELAAAAGCDPVTIRQQSSRFAQYITISRELIQGPRKRRWRVTRIALRNRVPA